MLKYYRYLHFLLFVLNLSWGTIAGQILPGAEAITIEDGLLFREVTNIQQGDYGLIWIGTSQGISRYDGYRFLEVEKVFHTECKLSDYLIRENTLKCIGDSILLFIGDQQLIALHLRDGYCEHIESNSNAKQEFVSLQNYNGDHSGTTFIVLAENDQYQYLYKYEYGHALELIDKRKLAGVKFASIASDTKGQIWWSNIVDGACRYTPDGRMTHCAILDSFNWYGRIMHMIQIFIDSEDRVLLFPKSRAAVWQYFPGENICTPLTDTIQEVIYNAVEDGQGNIWFAGNNSLYRYDTSGQWLNFTDPVKRLLDFTKINCLLVDALENLWIGTDNGILKFPVKKRLFKNHFNTQSLKWGHSCRGIFKDKYGALYTMIQNKKGLYKKSAAEGIHLVKCFGSPKATRIELDLAKHFIYDSLTHAAWTLTDKLIKIDLRTETARIVKDCRPYATRFGFNPLLRLSDGHFLFGYRLNRLQTYNPATDRMQALQIDLPPQIANVQTTWFCEAQDATLWIATADAGLFHLTRAGGVLQHFSLDSNPALSSNNIRVLSAGGDSLLWVGFFGGGMNKIDLRADSVEFFNKSDGLPDDNVVSILPYKNDYLIIGTYYGLACFNKKENRFQNYFTEDGLSHNEFNYGSFYKSAEDAFHFGGMNGVNEFNPLDLLVSVSSPAIIFTGFSKFDYRLDSVITHYGWLREGPAFVINPHDSYFEVDWTLPNYFKPEKNQYYTKLEGLDKDWIYQGKNATIRYFKIPAGDYVLRVKGADSRGNLCREELRVPITVLPIFYKTWWFLFLCIIFIAAVIYAIFMYRLRALWRIENMRMRISSDLHDEVGSMLSGLAMQAEILEMQADKKFQIHLHHLAELSRFAISRMRDLVWSIDSRRDKLADLVEKIREHAEDNLLPKNIHFELDTVALPMQKKLSIEQRQHLFLIFREAITNILRHSNASRVHILLKNKNPDFFKMAIYDNGTPDLSALRTTGQGLANMKMRAEELDGQLTLHNNGGFGVELTISPL